MTALRTFSVGALMALSLPFFTHAATLQELQAQVARLMQQLSAVQSQQGSVLNTSSSPGVPTRCPALARTLSRGMRGADVTQLQNFLISQNHLAAGNSTGFFGALTEAAVKKFQCAQNVVCTGTPASTGYGSVGAKTRAATAALCRKVSIASSYSQGSYTQGSYNTTLLPVTYSWQTGGWSACANSQQSRTVSCISSTNTTVADSVCTASKPAASQFCTTSTPSQSCTFNNQIVAHGASVTAYQASSVPSGYVCASEQRACLNGSLSGSYMNANCSVVVQATCAALPQETRAQSCPTGQTGSIMQTRTSVCATGATTPVWADWTTDSNSCTSNLSIPVTPNGEHISDYYIHATNKAALLINRSNSAPISQWAVQPLSTTKFTITWGNPANWPGPTAATEEFEIKTNCAGGLDYLWLNALIDHNTGARYNLETTRAEIKVGEGVWLDITNGGSCGTSGQPYMLRALTNEKYAIRLWGNIYNDGGLTVGRRFFWQHTVHPTQSTTNSCWQVDSVSTRLGLYQEEAWWDSASGWMNPERGVGSMGANGEPDGVYLPYVRGQFVGKGVGVGWLNTGAIEACMQQHWPW